MNKYKIKWDKDDSRWTVVTDEEWLCDCMDKDVAKMIARSLNITETEDGER